MAKNEMPNGNVCTLDTDLAAEAIRMPAPFGESRAFFANLGRTGESMFSQPYDFDVTRNNARDHLAFGMGQHFCIGSQLARMQSRVAYEEILTRLPDIRASASYSYWRSNHLSGLKTMPVVFTPA